MQEFAVKTVVALHLDELTQYVPELGDWLIYLSAGLGLLCCFFGYKLRNLWFAAVCLVFGCIVGSNLYAHEILDINFSVAVGLMAACVFVFSYRLAAPEIAFCIAYYLLVMGYGMRIETALIPCAILSIAAFFLDRWVLTLSTAAFGAFSVVNLLPILPLPEGWKHPYLSLLTPEHPTYFIALGVLALIGFLIQFGFGTANPLIRFRSKS